MNARKQSSQSLEKSWGKYFLSHRLLKETCLQGFVPLAQEYPVTTP